MKGMPIRLHPLMAIAAIAVIVFSIAGVAAIFGKIPGAESKPAEPFAQNANSNAGYPAPAAGRGSPSASMQGPQQAQAPLPCASCGVIDSIHVAEVQGQGSGLGAVAGGVAGGLLGNTIGHGTGRTVATIAGAAGGAYAGNSIEKHAKTHTVYRVTLRMDDGSMRTFSQREAPAYAVGDHVRVSNGRITERA